MNCEQMTMLLSAYLDGELSVQEEKQMQEHLEQCADCRALLEQLQTLHTSFSDLEEIPAPEGFVDGVMSRIQAESKPKVVPLFKRPQFRAVMGMAACAVLCIGFGRIALGGSGKSAAQEPMAAPVAPPMPEMAMYDAAPAESAMEYSVVAGPESKQVGAPVEPIVPMEPSAPAPESAEPAPTVSIVTPSGVTLDICTTGPEEILGEMVLSELPEGLEEIIGSLNWEERKADGALCARLTPNQAEMVMELAYKQSISLTIGEPAGGEPEAWQLVLLP